MKKTMIRSLAILFALVALFSMTVTAFAAKPVSCVSVKAATGGVKTVFYATVPANKAGSIKLTMTKGGAITNAGIGTGYKCYASYEIRVFRYANGAWREEQKFNAKNTSSQTISLKKYSTGQKYRIEVWCWKLQTILTTYIKDYANIRLAIYAAGGVASPYWNILPSCTSKNSSNCTLYTACP